MKKLVEEVKTPTRIELFKVFLELSDGWVIFSWPCDMNPGVWIERKFQVLDEELLNYYKKL